MSRNYLQGFDKVLEITRKIGDCLPQFKKFGDLFKESRSVREILGLFYKDILEFYAIMLKFFQTKGMSRDHQSNKRTQLVARMESFL